MRRPGLLAPILKDKTHLVDLSIQTAVILTLTSESKDTINIMEIIVIDSSSESDQEIDGANNVDNVDNNKSNSLFSSDDAEVTFLKWTRTVDDIGLGGLVVAHLKEVIFKRGF